MYIKSPSGLEIRAQGKYENYISIDNCKDFFTKFKNS